MISRRSTSRVSPLFRRRASLNCGSEVPIVLHTQAIAAQVHRTRGLGQDGTASGSQSLACCVLCADWACLFLLAASALLAGVAEKNCADIASATAGRVFFIILPRRGSAVSVPWRNRLREMETQLVKSLSALEDVEQSCPCRGRCQHQQGVAGPSPLVDCFALPHAVSRYFHRGSASNVRSTSAPGESPWLPCQHLDRWRCAPVGGRWRYGQVSIGNTLELICSVYFVLPHSLAPSMVKRAKCCATLEFLVTLSHPRSCCLLGRIACQSD